MREEPRQDGEERMRGEVSERRKDQMNEAEGNEDEWSSERRGKRKTEKKVFNDKTRVFLSVVW